MFTLICKELTRKCGHGSCGDFGGFRGFIGFGGFIDFGGFNTAYTTGWRWTDRLSDRPIDIIIYRAAVEVKNELFYLSFWTKPKHLKYQF